MMARLAKFSDAMSSMDVNCVEATRRWRESRYGAHAPHGGASTAWRGVDASTRTRLDTACAPLSRQTMRRGHGDGVEAGTRRRPRAVAPSSRRGHREDGASTRPDSARSPPLSFGFGRRAHAWRRCSWAMSSDISLSTSSRGLSPGWDFIIAAILLLLRPLSTSDSAQSASAVISVRKMAEMPQMRRR